MWRLQNIIGLTWHIKLRFAASKHQVMTIIVIILMVMIMIMNHVNNALCRAPNEANLGSQRYMLEETGKQQETRGTKSRVSQ